MSCSPGGGREAPMKLPQKIFMYSIGTFHDCKSIVSRLIEMSRRRFGKSESPFTLVSLGRFQGQAAFRGAK